MSGGGWAAGDDFLKRQRYINAAMWPILYDWLATVSFKFHCLPRTVQLAFDDLRRYLHVTPDVRRSQLQLVGVGCLFFFRSKHIGLSGWVQTWGGHVLLWMLVLGQSLLEQSLQTVRAWLCLQLGTLAFFVGSVLASGPIFVMISDISALESALSRGSSYSVAAAAARWSVSKRREVKICAQEERDYFCSGRRWQQQMPRARRRLRGRGGCRR